LRRAASPAVAGYEAQIYEGGVLNAAKTGSLFAGAGPAVVRVNESHIRPGQWFTMEAIAKETASLS